jgi:6-pyruvoyl tetrahydropterin synthase/QueD family protein
MDRLVKIYKVGYFESAHQLRGHEKCGLLHGHSYKYEVWITGIRSGEWNFVIDFHDIKNYFNQFDHSNKVITKSCEDFVVDAVDYFFNLSENIKKVKVRVWETVNSYAEHERIRIKS